MSRAASPAAIAAESRPATVKQSVGTRSCSRCAIGDAVHGHAGDAVDFIEQRRRQRSLVLGDRVSMAVRTASVRDRVGGGTARDAAPEILQIRRRRHPCPATFS